MAHDLNGSSKTEASLEKLIMWVRQVQIIWILLIFIGLIYTNCCLFASCVFLIDAHRLCAICFVNVLWPNFPNKQNGTFVQTGTHRYTESQAHGFGSHKLIWMAFDHLSLSGMLKRNHGPTHTLNSGANGLGWISSECMWFISNYLNRKTTNAQKRTHTRRSIAKSPLDFQLQKFLHSGVRIASITLAIFLCSGRYLLAIYSKWALLPKWMSKQLNQKLFVLVLGYSTYPFSVIYLMLGKTSLSVSLIATQRNETN